MWDIRGFKKPIEEYTGPGLMVEWIKIEGPIDPWPPPGYQTLFAGVPLKPRSVAEAESGGKNRRRDSRQPIRVRMGRRSARPGLRASEGGCRAVDPRFPAASLPPAGERRGAEAVRRARPRQARPGVHVPRRDDLRLQGDLVVAALPAARWSPARRPAREAICHRRSWTTIALADRLSYFLWSTLPDEELLDLAAEGRADASPRCCAPQVERMLERRRRRTASPRTSPASGSTCARSTPPSPIRSSTATSTASLLWAMPRETELFFEEVLRNDLSLLEFVDSDWTMLNERLAEALWHPRRRRERVPQGDAAARHAIAAA